MSKYDIAIIGMGCVFPEANNVQEYWENILSGDQYVKEMPEKYWHMDSFYSKEKNNNKTCSKEGCFIKDFDFNPLDYKLPPKSFDGVDIAQLVALEATRQALEDAGIKPHSKELEDAITIIGGSGVDEYAHVSLYLNRLKFQKKFSPYLKEQGFSDDDIEKLYVEFTKSLEKRGHKFHPTTSATGAIISSVPNRVSQVFGIKGTNMSVDGACASSFVSLTIACQALMAGDCKIALSGGIDLGINPPIYIGFSRLGGLSPTGNSNPFDSSADGLVIGEGGGIVVLKRLEDAVADGDKIKAVIRGVATTSDGAGQAIYNPSVEQRSIALRNSLKTAGLQAKDIQYLEAHATSTVVGDANEYDAISTIYSNRDSKDPLQLGTVKHQIGHIKAAAGVAGLIKIVMAMNEGTIPHMPRFKKLTKYATKKSDNLNIPNELQEWKPRENGSRYGAVTASGFGGVNYHAIIEQAPEYTHEARPKVNRRMAIVKIACRLPGAVDEDTFWNNLEQEKNLFVDTDVKKLGWEEHVGDNIPYGEKITTRKISLIDDYDINHIRHKISPKSVSQISPAQLLSVEMADRLLTGYGLDFKAHKSIGVSIGAIHDDNYSTISFPLSADEYAESIRQTDFFKNNTSKFGNSLSKVVDEIIEIGPPHTEATLPGWMSNINAGIIANRLNCNGPNFTVDTACSSSLASMMPAMYQLMFSDIDMMIAGGVNRHTTNVFISTICGMGAMADEIPAPYDETGKGFLTGEGGVMFLLKRQADAERDGDKIIATIENVAGSSEYKAKTMFAPSENALRHAIKESIDGSGINPERIGVVDTHGSANLVSDVAEVQAIAKELRNGDNTPAVHITAVKSHIGHIFGGSGAAGILSVIQSLRNRKVPGIRNLKNYRPEIKDVLDRAKPQMGLVDLEDQFDAGAITSLGLGGSNYCVVVTTPDQKSSKKQAPVSSAKQDLKDVFVTTANSNDELVANVKNFLESGDSVVASNAKLCLTVSYDSKETLKKKLNNALAFIEKGMTLKPLESQGIFFNSKFDQDQGKFAFCFPGQGTQYVTMGKALYDNNSTFKQIVDEIDALAIKHMNFPLVNLMYKASDSKVAMEKLSTLEGAQISVFAIELGIYKVLGEMGIKPDVMIGHSFGEISALAAQGVWDVETAFKVVQARIEAANLIVNSGQNLKMLSLGCTEDQMGLFLNLGGDDVVLSNIHAPGQYIIAGKEAAILNIVKTAETFGVEAKMLQIASAFHSKFMYDAVKPFREKLEVLHCNQPTIPLLSTITGEYITFKDNKELADILSKQLTTQLNMQREITRLYNDGVKNFLEIGPKWALSKMIEATLSGKDINAVPTIHPKIGDEETFRRAMAYLVSIGKISVQESGSDDLVDTAFLTYLKSNEPSVLALLDEARNRFANGSIVASAPKAISSPVAKAQITAAPSAPSTPAISTKVVIAKAVEDVSVWIDRARAKLAESTGYPEDMLDADLDLEADLGIDSIQRAEIWFSFIKEFGLDEEAKPTKISTLTELATELAKLAGGSEVIESAPATTSTSSASVPTSNANAEDVSVWIDRARTKLAESTGYPEDMLDADLDLEADLGIDSIQRAEIWFSFIKEFGLNEEAKPTKISTLTELATELAKLAGGNTGGDDDNNGGGSTAPAASNSAAEGIVTDSANNAANGPKASGEDLQVWIDRARTKLAESTGYPEDMLDADLDLEADLGIDSIQRAEIWFSFIKEFGLDEEAKPTKISSLTELASELLNLSQGSTSSTSKTTKTVNEDIIADDNGVTPNELFYSGISTVGQDQISNFDCKNVLAIVDTAKDIPAWEKTFAAQKKEAKVITVKDFLAANDANDMAKAADTIYILLHSKLHKSKKKGTELAKLMLDQAHTLYDTFKAMAETLKSDSKRIICPITQDGAFGAGKDNYQVQGSFPAGLIRSLSYELTGCKFQLIDTGSLTWKEAVERSIGITFNTVEVGLINNEWVYPSLSTITYSENYEKAPLSKGDLVLVTGGARGIVFECVHRLAEKTKCKLLLTGRTNLAKGNEEWLNASADDINKTMKELEMSLVKSKKMNLGEAKRFSHTCRSQWEVNNNLNRLKASGIEASYEKCDVVDNKALKALIEKVSKKDTIKGIVHGAGVQKSKLFEELDKDAISRTIETKLNPLFTMMGTIDFKKVKLLSGFGSIAGLFGNMGQTDYSLANDVLACTIASLGQQYPNLLAVTVEWTAWVGTGMATEAETKRFAEMGLNPVTVSSGVDLYDQAIFKTNLPRLAAFNKGAEFASNRQVNESVVSAKAKDYMLTSKNAITITKAEDIYVNQHLVGHISVVPGTFVTEIISEAVKESKNKLSIANVKFRRPLQVRDDSIDIEVVINDDSVLVLPKDRPVLEGKALTNLSFSGCDLKKIEKYSEEKLPKVSDKIKKQLLEESKNVGNLFYEKLDAKFSDVLISGPIFRGCKATVKDKDLFYGHIYLTDDASKMFKTPGKFQINPIVSDMAIQIAAAWGILDLDVMAIPYEFGEIHVYNPTTSRDAVVICEAIEQNKEEAKLHITVREWDGTPIFTMRNVILKTIPVA